MHRCARRATNRSRCSRARVSGCRCAGRSGAGRILADRGPGYRRLHRRSSIAWAGAVNRRPRRRDGMAGGSVGWALPRRRLRLRQRDQREKREQYDYFLHAGIQRHGSSGRLFARRRARAAAGWRLLVRQRKGGRRSHRAGGGCGRSVVARVVGNRQSAGRRGAHYGGGAEYHRIEFLID